MITIKDSVESLLPSLDEYFQSQMQEKHILGMSVGIVLQDKVVYSKGFGYKNIKTQEPVTPETTFQICSISKIFTALLAMEQFEQGKFKLDDDVNRYLPHDRVGYVGSKKPNANKVTFKQLLTHTAGIGEIKAYSDLLHIRSVFDFVQPSHYPIIPLEGIFKKGIPCYVEPGTKYCYANQGITLLGYLTEQFTGQQWHEMVLDRILKPLKMDKTDAVFSDRVSPYFAFGYTFNGKRYKRAKHYWSWGRPAGGIYSCTEDIMKFMQFLLHKAQTDNLSLLKQKTFEMMIETQNCLDPRLENLGLVFHLFKLQHQNKEFTIAWHGGHTVGFNCIMIFDIENQLGIILLGNTSNKRPTYFLMRDLLWKIYGIDNVKIKNDLISNQVPLDLGFMRKLSGVYGNERKGFLTNIRNFLDFGEFIVFEKNKSLWIQSLWGIKKKGVRLYPLDEKDSFLFGITEQLGPYTMIPIEPVLFVPNAESQVTKLYFELSELVKKSGIKKLKTKLLLLKVVAICLIVGLTIRLFI